MSEKKVLKVRVLDIVGYQMLQFKLTVFEKEHAVTMVEDEEHVLSLYFTCFPDLTIYLHSSTPPRPLMFMHRQGAAPPTFEDALGAPLDADEYRSLAFQLVPVARLFYPAIEVAGPGLEFPEHAAQSVSLLGETATEVAEAEADAEAEAEAYA